MANLNNFPELQEKDIVVLDHNPNQCSLDIVLGLHTTAEYQEGPHYKIEVALHKVPPEYQPAQYCAMVQQAASASRDMGRVFGHIKLKNQLLIVTGWKVARVITSEEDIDTPLAKMLGYHLKATDTDPAPAEVPMRTQGMSFFGHEFSPAAFSAFLLAACMGTPSFMGFRHFPTQDPSSSNDKEEEFYDSGDDFHDGLYSEYDQRSELLALCRRDEESSDSGDEHEEYTLPYGLPGSIFQSKKSGKVTFMLDSPERWLEHFNTLSADRYGPGAEVVIKHEHQVPEQRLTEDINNKPVDSSDDSEYDIYPFPYGLPGSILQSRKLGKATFMLDPPKRWLEHLHTFPVPASAFPYPPGAAVAVPPQEPIAGPVAPTPPSKKRKQPSRLAEETPRKRRKLREDRSRLGPKKAKQ